MIFTAGDSFSETFTVSADTHKAFIAVFRDENPLHTDAAFAVSKGFKGMVMHGNILNGFISFFIGECLPLKNVIIHSQDIQFKHPVYVNDNLQFTATVISVSESVNVVEFKYSFTNSESKTVAKGKIQIGILL